MNANGTAHKYGDNVDTDVIIPARYLNTSDPKELAEKCMCDIDADFVKKIKVNDIMVAGFNFGCGSSREHAPIAIKASGISCVIAKSFARIFYRNAINIGLPILECVEASERIDDKDEVEINFDTGEIINKTKNETYQAQPFPAFIQNIMQHNGLLNAIKEQGESNGEAYCGNTGRWNWTGNCQRGGEGSGCHRKEIRTQLCLHGSGCRRLRH